jgi:hypothetical protein
LFRSKILLPSALGSIAARLSQNACSKQSPLPLLPGFYLFSAEPQILKFNPHCFVAKFRRNFVRRAAKFRSFIQSPAGSRKTRAIKFTPPLYDFVLSAQHFIAAETMYFRRSKNLSPCPAEQAPFKFYLEARF